MGLVLQLVETRAGSKAQCIGVQQAAVAVQARAYAALWRSRTALGGGGAVPQLLDSPLQDAGHDTRAAEQLLLNLRRTLEAWRDHREAILREISRLECASPR